IMWISDVTFDGLKVRGTLLNQPNWLTSVQEGDAVEIAPKELCDWMYAIAGRVYGGFTVQLLRSRMPRGERAQHDKAWGMDFGDPQVIHVVPPEFVRPKPGLLGKLIGAGKQPLTAEDLESTEHPMAVNMGESLSELLAKSPARVGETDDQGFTLMHQMALAGTAIGCEILLKHKANPSAVAHNGMTPLRLAKSLGWKQVVQLLEKHGAK
ncbi:MAG: DUF2314 domain-containing protein, partial [Pirellulaceae bacterium]|nr:DUF2314 domain-containing protein [Pirellulaceae bacterium]